jgi:DNA-binding response OmpR family regulator
MDATMRTLLLLVVDSALRKSLRRTLGQYNLIEASTAEQALRLFVDNGRYVDLLLIDVSVGSAGLRVAMFLRSEVRNLPVVVMAGYPVDNWSARDSVDLQRLGANSTVLNKPFQPTELAQLVQDLLQSRPPNPPRLRS